MKENKEIHYPYYCKKCNKTVYFNENDEINSICKTCGNEMDKWNPIISYQKQSLKNVNEKKSYSYMNSYNTKPTITCPYCQSTNVSKIGTLGRMVSVGFWGLASGKVGKQWHCKKCGSDF